MGVFLIEIPAILLFVLFADKRRMRELFPLTMSAVFLRFLDQFIVIDWLGYYNITGGMHRHLWIPISADVTVWPVSTYFYFQYMPRQRAYRMPYSLLFVLAMVLYLRLCVTLGVFILDHGLTFAHIFGTVSLYFVILYLLWKWLARSARTGGDAR